MSLLSPSKQRQRIVQYSSKVTEKCPTSCMTPVEDDAMSGVEAVNEAQRTNGPSATQPFPGNTCIQ
jgi:hypothetical protein